MSESTRRILKMASEIRPALAAASDRRNKRKADGRGNGAPAGHPDEGLRLQVAREQLSPASRHKEYSSLQRLGATFWSCKSKSNTTEFDRIEKQHKASLFGLQDPKRAAEPPRGEEDFDHSYSKLKNILNRFSSLEADPSPSTQSRLLPGSNNAPSDGLTPRNLGSLPPVSALICKSGFEPEPGLKKADPSRTDGQNGGQLTKEGESAGRLEELNRVIADLEHKLAAVLSMSGLRHCDKLVLESWENIQLAIAKQNEIEREEKHVFFVALENDNQSLKKALAAHDQEHALRIAELAKQLEGVKEENKRLLLATNNPRLVASNSQNHNFSRSYLAIPSGADGMEENFFDNIIKTLEKDIEVNADKIHQLGIEGASPMVRLVSGAARDPCFKSGFAAGQYLESQYPNSFSKSGDPSSKMFSSTLKQRDPSSRKEEKDQASAQKEVKSSSNQDSNSNNHKISENAHSLFEDNKKLSSIGKNHSFLAGFKIDQSKISSYEAPFSNSIATKAKDLSDILKASVLRASADRGAIKTPSPEMVDSINLFDRLSEESPSTIKEVATILKEREQKILKKTEELNREVELFDANREQFKLKVLEDVETQINQKIEEINDIQTSLEQRKQFIEEREAYLAGWEQWLAEQEAAFMQRGDEAAEQAQPLSQQARIFRTINDLQVEVAKQESLVEYFKNECEQLKQQLQALDASAKRPPKPQSAAPTRRIELSRPIVTVGQHSPEGRPRSHRPL